MINVIAVRGDNSIGTLFRERKAIKSKNKQKYHQKTKMEQTWKLISIFIFIHTRVWRIVQATNDKFKIKNKNKHRYFQ